MAQPVTENVRAPRLTAPGSRAFQTQPDGLWVTLGIGRTDAVTHATYVDCIVIEVCARRKISATDALDMLLERHL
jgi:hypothetical protein